MKQVTFLGEVCNVNTSLHYDNGRPSIKLTIAETGEPMATATINVPYVELKEGETIIKDYSENEGMLKVLEEAGIVKSTGHFVNSGFVSCPVVTIIN